MEKIKLFCIPYAGGSASVYFKWKKYFNDNIEVCPIELAGRGSRFYEKPYTSISDITNDVYNLIKYGINEGPYMILGHSMGALIAYELINMISRNGDNKPIHAFFSGKGAPQIKFSENNIYKQSDEKFIEEVYSLGGTPKELLEQKELLEIFIEILRADYEAIETYKYFEGLDKFSFPISIFNGSEDKLTEKKVLQWRVHTKKECNIYNFQGGHFFINDSIEEICKIIECEVKKYTNVKVLI